MQASMAAFVDELTKMKTAGVGNVMDFLRRMGPYKGKAALIGTGIAGTLAAQRLGQDVAFAERARHAGYMG